MKYIFLLHLIFIISGCATFNVPVDETSSFTKGVFNQKKNVVLEFKKSKTDKGDLSAEFLKYNIQALNSFGCFENVIINQTSNIRREEGDIYLELERHFNVDYYPLSLFSIMTVGVIPYWTKFVTEVHVIKVNNGREVELTKFSFEETQVLSIFVAPIGLYRALNVPSGINANEWDRVKTNKYLFQKVVDYLGENKYFVVEGTGAAR